MVLKASISDQLARILEASLISFLGMRNEGEGPLYNYQHECLKPENFPIQDETVRFLAGVLLMAEAVEKMMFFPRSVVEVPWNTQSKSVSKTPGS